jgi:hypothetical protein
MTTAHTRTHAQRVPFDVAAQIAALEARITGTRGDTSDPIDAPPERWTTDSDADWNERRDSAMRMRQEEAAS